MAPSNSIRPDVNAWRYLNSSVRVFDDKYGVSVMSRLSPHLIKYGTFMPVPSCDVVLSEGIKKPDARSNVGSGKRRRGR